MLKHHTYEIFPNRHSSALSLGYTSVDSLRDFGTQTVWLAVHCFAFSSVRNYPVNQPYITKNRKGLHKLSKTQSPPKSRFQKGDTKQAIKLRTRNF